MRKSIQKYFPQELVRELAASPMYDMAEELRIRAEKQVMFYAGGREYVLNYRTDPQVLRKMVFALSEHSMTAFFDELRQGFFTVGKGIRIGVAGRVVCEKGTVKMIRDYSSLNIRFPKDLKGICAPILPYVLREGKICSTLIISAPQHGKTTLLRDLVRAVSDGEGCEPQKCSVIDERSEISGGMNFDLGLRTDVLLGCPKEEGMRMALRSLSPQVLATDEIGGEHELETIFDAAVSGVKVIATAHASSREELMQRIFFQRIFREKVIERTVVLSERLGRGTVEQIYDVSGKAMLQGPVALYVKDEYGD